MIYLRLANERGNADFGWLNSKHSFSFGNYYDPKHMGISALRVINDDTVAPGAGFGTHGHRDMEIISYILEGEVEHKDNMGNTYVIPAGEIQRISAGTGITHSEYNRSPDAELKFLQIWIQPDSQGIKPEYEQKRIEQNGNITPLVTPDGEGESMSIHQDARLYRVMLAPGEELMLSSANRTCYLHVIDGEASYGSIHLAPGDGLGLADESHMLKAGDKPVTALWFDLPAASR